MTFIFLTLLCACSITDSALNDIEDSMIEKPEWAFRTLAEIDSLSMSEQQKARRALLQGYLATVYVTPVDMSAADLKRASSAFAGACTTDEVKSLIIQSEFAKSNNNPVASIELLKDAEFLATQLDDISDLAFIYLYLANVYADGYNGIVSEYYANKSLSIFKDLGYRKQSIDARMAIVGALAVKRDYATAVDSMRSMKDEVLKYSAESYKLYFLDMFARFLDEDGRSREAIELWQSIYPEGCEMANTLAHWAYAYLHNNQLDSAEILINKAISLPHNNSDEYLCRNVQYMILDRQGRKSALPEIDSLRAKAANMDFDDRKIAESSLALNLKYETVTKAAWKEMQANKQRAIILIASSIVVIILLIGGLLFYRKRNKLLNAENENNLLRLQNLENNLFEKERQNKVVAEKVSELFKAPLSAIDYLASAYFECKDTGQEQKRILAETKKVIEDFRSDESLAKMEDIVNTANDNLMRHFDEDFPNISASQRRLALFLFCGLSLQSISVFQDTDIRNIYVYKSRLKSIISKSKIPRRDLYLSYFT